MTILTLYLFFCPIQIYINFALAYDWLYWPGRSRECIINIYFPCANSYGHLRIFIVFIVRRSIVTLFFIFIYKVIFLSSSSSRYRHVMTFINTRSVPLYWHLFWTIQKYTYFVCARVSRARWWWTIICCDYYIYHCCMMMRELRRRSSKTKRLLIRLCLNLCCCWLRDWNPFRRTVSDWLLFSL